MTQNLRLLGARTLTSANSDVTSNYALPASSDSGWCTDDTEACYNKQNVLGSGNTTYGVYYSWVAATAGTGTYSMISGNASSSICPKGWRLPTGGSSGEFQGLYDAGYNTTAKMQSTDGTIGPGFVLSGYRLGGGTNYQGSNGRYWSSTAYGSGGAYGLSLYSWNVFPASGYYKYYGFSVRCVAK